MYKRHEVPSDVIRLFRFIEAKEDLFVNDLKEIISIQSISSQIDKWDDINKVTEWMETRLKSLGARVEICSNGVEELPDGKSVKRPRILIAQFPRDPAKKTILVYGYLDVSPANREDGWDSDPFDLTKKDGKLYGRGVCSNKGIIIAWLHVIEVYKLLKIPIPINIKFILEGLNEVESPNFSNFILDKRSYLFDGTDGIVITNSAWIGPKKPCIVYGQRGSCSFTVEISGGHQNINSGTYAGAVFEPMSDLTYILNQLVDGNANIKIPGISKDVIWLTPEEEQIYKNIDVDMALFKKGIGANRLAHKEVKERVLMHMWRNPSLSIHGIEGSFNDAGTRTIIPSKVTGRFTIQIVENQVPACIYKCVDEYIKKLWMARKSPNIIDLKMTKASFPWSENTCSPIYVAAKKAVLHPYKLEGNMIREGGQMAVVNMLKNVGKTPILLLAVNKSGDKLKGVNEQMATKTYIEAHNFLAGFMYEVAQMKKMPAAKVNPKKK